MIPMNFLRKIGVYSLNLNGVTVEAKVVDNEELVKDGVTELRNKLDPKFPIVGIDWKCIAGSLCGLETLRLKLLVLYVDDRCLLVQFGGPCLQELGDSLPSFMSDQSICFLSLKDPKEFTEFFCHSDLLATGVNIGTFAAKVLKNPELKRYTNLAEMATKVGLPVQEQASPTASSQCPVPDWGAVCFTQEQVKYALKDAYECYRIGMKVMSALN